MRIKHQNESTSVNRFSLFRREIFDLLKFPFTQTVKDNEIIFHYLRLVTVFLILLAFTYIFNETLGNEGSGVLLAFNLMAGSINGKFSNMLKNKLAVLSLLINNYCNLSCKHCYLQAKKFAPYLSPEEWDKFLLTVFWDLKPTTLCFAGKEVFFDGNSANILFDAVKIRNDIQKYEPNKTEIGVITNGTLLHNFKDSLPNYWPDYIDISIDGLPHIHNEIRGKGAFESLENNLFWLRNSFPGNIWITHTVLQNNIDTLPEFISYIYKRFEITRFSVGLFKENLHTDQRLKLNYADVSALFNKTFHKLAQINFREPVEVIVEMDHTQKTLIPILFDSGWIEPVNALSSTAHRFSNNLSLKFNVARIPVGLWRAVRITPEGYWLAAEDLMAVTNYHRVAVANIRDFNYNALELYEAGLHSTRFRELNGEFNNELKKTLLSNHENLVLA